MVILIGFTDNLEEQNLLYMEEKYWLANLIHKEMAFPRIHISNLFLLYRYINTYKMRGPWENGVKRPTHMI